MRKIVQCSLYRAQIVAVCDDGTMWLCQSGQWAQIPPIPQPPAMCPECLGRREVMHCDRGFMERAACTRCGGAGVVEVTP